ncbi:hypothetical protein OKW21_003349 [Catalinimonas alkaloidigena]|nr:hypothetical protein [Catalinimonas alkaloidigena]
MVFSSGFSKYIVGKIVTIIRLQTNYYAKNILFQLLNVLTVFTPKRLLYFSLILLLVSCGDSSEKISGNYETTVTSPSQLYEYEAFSKTLNSDSTQVNDLGISLKLNLFEDHRAELTIDFMDARPDIKQKGSWELTGNQRVTAYFVEKNGKYFRDTLLLRNEGLRLMLKSKQSSSLEDITLMRLQ